MSTSNHTYRIIIWGDVTFEGGCMFVGDPNGGTSGITCIIEVANDHVGDVVIKNGGTNSFFRVLPNNTLIIKGSADKRIIFDGGATTTTANGTSNEMLASDGTLVLQHVVFRNNVNTAGWNPAVKINPWNHFTQDADNKIGKTTILNCEFYNLKGKYSPVLFCDEAKASADLLNLNTPQSCSILIKDTDIHDCEVIEGDGRTSTDAGKYWGGLIRTRGGWVGNLTMTNVKMYNNKASDCSCAGVFWNAFGDRKDRKPVLTLKGCEFYGNYTKYSGGAMRIETNCVFDSIPTKIHDNTAEIMGGGIHIYGYAGGKKSEFTATMDFNYDLNENLIMFNNKAQYGGAIGFQLTDECKLYNGSAFNAHFNGANLYNNKATVKGGGLYFEDITTGTNAGIYDVNFYLNKGTINGNIVSPTPDNPVFDDDQVVATSFYDSLNGAGKDRLKSSGGGVFLFNANIGYEENLAGTMTMDGNKASRFGGAIAVLGTEALLNLQGLTASSNEAWRGGGLACYSLTDDKTKYAGIRLGNLTLSGNTAYDYGGGAFIEKGKLEILNNASISGCTATSRGGGVSCLVNSIINLKNATISGCTANIGAGLDLEESSLDMNNATFSGNIANSNGGGLYVEKNAIFKIYGRAQFLNNESTNDGGGGICLKTNEGYTSTGNSIENAFFSGNSAYRGGAVELDGFRDLNTDPDNLSLTLNNAEFTNNEANLGGAILVNEAKLTYKGGLIYGNKAVLRPGSNLPKTSFGYFPYAFNVNCFHDRDFSGFGGGIIVSKMGSLIIEGGSPFGIYGNSADIAGNDISTVCSDKTIYNGGSNMDTKADYKFFPATLTIPQPESLDLTGFKIPIPKAAVKWMEDYNSEDGAYSKGTNRQGSTHERYGTLLKSADGIKKLSNLIVDATTMSTAIKGNKYLHLTLGYNFVFVKLVKQGLKAGESAIFNILYKDGSNYVKYMTVSVTNTSDTDGAEASQIIALSAGDWLFEETSWAWAYTRPNAQSKTLTDADASNMPIITFTNTRKDGIDSTAPNAEGYKQNEFKN
ncbi:MAG: hypothetical protein ACI309_02310 [Candidatus Limisoma sp.]